MAIKKPRNTVKPRPSAVVPPRIVPPAELDASEQAVWDELIREATWLTRFDRYNLHIYCCAAAKYRRDPKSASNALVGRIRSMGTRLRLDDPPDKRKAHHVLFDPEQPQKPLTHNFFNDAPDSPEEIERQKRLKYYFPDDD